VRTTLPALALALAACSSADDRGAPAASGAPLGPDAIVLRVPATGGPARAYRYPALDTLIWTTRAALPAQVQPLAFSIDAGTLAFRDGAGVAWRLTLGSGQLERAYAAPLDDAVSLDGTTVYGTSDGTLLRLTTTESTPWRASTAARQSQLQPLRDGGVLLIGQRPPETVLTRFRPPATTPVDSAVLSGPARLISAAGGDRYYLSDGPRGLVSVRARDLETLGTIALGDSIVATTSSPSGDRVYVLGHDDDEARVQVIAKYTDEIIAKIDVPADARDLRMDPLGRYVLVRTGGDADSVLVIGVATNAVVGRIVSPWRADLPLVLPDGRLATLRGDDVLVLSADRFQAVSVVALGARDIWAVVQWNGFRRRSGDGPFRASAARVDTTTRRATDTALAAGASVDSAGSGPPADSGAGSAVTDSSSQRRRSRADSTRRSGRTGDSLRRTGAQVDTLSATRVRPPQAATPPAAPATLGVRGTFVVQFAALKAEQPARRLASSIKANGEQAHVVVTSSNGSTLYRVILGPFQSRADAEAAGRASARDYWVFEGGTN
jgi:DNA-binding beta-propeller fold protein YncE